MYVGKSTAISPQGFNKNISAFCPTVTDKLVWHFVIYHCVYVPTSCALPLLNGLAEPYLNAQLVASSAQTFHESIVCPCCFLLAVGIFGKGQCCEFIIWLEVCTQLVFTPLNRLALIDLAYSFLVGFSLGAREDVLPRFGATM